MKFLAQDNRRDSDGSKFLYITPENQAETCQIDNLIQKLRQWNIEGNEFDLGEDGIKSLCIRILHYEAGRKDGPPIIIKEERATLWQKHMDVARAELTGLPMNGRDPGPIPDDFMPNSK